MIHYVEFWLARFVADAIGIAFLVLLGVGLAVTVYWAYRVGWGKE